MPAAAERSEPDAPQAGTGHRLVIELDVVSVASLVAAALAGLAVLAVFRIAPSTITKVAVGVLLAFALDPLVVRAGHRFRWSRSTAVAFVAAGLVTVFGVAAVLLGPAAAREARGLATELPATVERIYDWPLVGDRLQEVDAAGQVDRWIDELPARLDDRTVADIADTVLQGIQTLALVLIVAVAVLIDGEVLVARARRLLPPGRRRQADQLGRIAYRTVGNYFAGSLLVATINGLVILTAGLLLGVPLAPLAALWATLTNLIPQIGGFLGGGLFVLLAVTEGPLVGLVAAVVFLLYQQIENNVVAPVHRRQGGKPVAARHHARGPHRRRRSRRAGRAGGHSPGRHREGHLPRTATWSTPTRGAGRVTQPRRPASSSPGPVRQAPDLTRSA